MLMTADLNHKYQAIISTFKRASVVNDQIVVYQLDDHSRETIDAWANTVWQDFQAWSADKPYMALHDFRNSGFSNYARERGQELSFNLPQHIHGCMVLVVADSVVGRSLGKAIQFIMARHHRRLTIRAFTDFDEALQWLEDSLS